MAEKNQSAKIIRTVIAVLVALLIISLCALAARIVYLSVFKTDTSTSVISDNLIGESSPTYSTEVMTAKSNTESSVSLELYKGQPSDSEKFEVYNMLPGDSEVKYFTVTVSHHADVALYFGTEVTEQTKELAGILRIRVTPAEGGQVLYDGTFADMSADGYVTLCKADSETETAVSYKIEVYLPTSAGNEYRSARLMANFNWYVKDDGALDPPDMGISDSTSVWLVGAGCSAAVIIILLFSKRRKEKEDEYEETK